MTSNVDHDTSNAPGTEPHDGNAAAPVCWRRPQTNLRLAAAAFTLGALLYPSGAHACGGLFCSLANPVEQTAERIVFAQKGKQITAIIEIRYEGPSERFAWLVPMPGTPKVNVSTPEVLDALSRSTEPRYVVETSYDGDCAVDWDEAGAVDAGVLLDGGVDETITVLDQGNAGPYDYVTIKVEQPTEDVAEVAIEWLTTNGYDVGATAPELLRPYLDEGLSLIAFRLTKGNDVGAIRPVQITYEAALPVIPLRPTAVAAQADMAIEVYLLGESRAVSENYLHVELNETRIPWGEGSVPRELRTEAISEAGEHAFLTDFAGPTQAFRDRIWTPELQSSWSSLLTSPLTGVDLLMTSRWPFAAYAGFRRAVEASLTLPEDVSFDDFTAYPSAYRDVAEVDEATFLSQLQTEVVEPLSSAQALVDAHPYLTRLSTFISPEEMTVDPSFAYNSSLPDVPRERVASKTVVCGEETFGDRAPWTLVLPDETVLEGVADSRPWAELSGAPAAARVLQYGPKGQPMVVSDNRAAIDKAVRALSPPEPQADPTVTDAGPSSADGTAQENTLDSGTTSSDTGNHEDTESPVQSVEDAGPRSTRSPTTRDDAWCNVAPARPLQSNHALFTSGLLVIVGSAWTRRRRRA